MHMHRALFCAVFMSLMAIGNSTTCISHIGPINSDGVTCQDFSLGNGEHEVCYEFGMCGICCDQCADAPNCEYAMEEPEYQCPAGYEGGPCSSTSANLKTFLDTWGSYCYEYAKDYDGGVLHDYCADQGLCSICCKECAGAPGCTICNSGGPPPCAAGSTGPAGSCTLCVAGKYKDTTGSAACDTCSVGKFSTATGQTSFTTCQTCSPGTYANLAGSWACTLCPTLSTSPAGSTSFTQCTCNTGSTGPAGGPCVADRVLAYCEAGHADINGVCQKCVIGTYKPTAGTQKCTGCSAVDSDGQPYTDTSIALPWGRRIFDTPWPYGATSQSACICSTMYTGSGGAAGCTRCPVEQYKEDPGNLPCKSCTQIEDSCNYYYNTYYDYESGDELPGGIGVHAEKPVTNVCVPGTGRVLGTYVDPRYKRAWTNSHCSCDMGWTAYPGVVRYSAFTFKPDGYYMQPNSRYCVQCAIGKYKNWRSTPSSSTDLCINCPAFSTNTITGSKTLNDCICNTGYIRSSDWSAQEWIDPVCNGVLSNLYGGTCDYQKLIVQSNNPGSRGTCLKMCDPGYTGPHGGPCTQCVAGKYKAAYGSAACDNCNAGTYSTTVGAVSSTSCLNCPQFSTSVAGSSAVTQCTCNAGYLQDTSTTPFTCQSQPCSAGSTGPAGSCTLCAAGKYKAASGSAACDTCLPGKFSGTTGQSSSGTCQNCLAGKWSLHGFAACEDCREGTYGPNAGADCIYCPQGKFSAATGQSSSVSCQNCNAGTYSNLLGASVCTSCPAGSTSPAASNFKTQCFCNAGFVGGFVGGFETTVTEKACQDHPTYLKAGMKCDHWAEGHPSGNNPYCVLDGVCNRCCASCRNRCEGAGQYLETCQQYCWNLGPATNVTKIVPYDSCTECDAGKYKSSAGGPEPGHCLVCEAGKYSAAGSSACQLCPASSTSPAGSSAVTQCTCNAGYVKSGDVCVAPCNAGYTGPVGELCTPCAEGKYKTEIGSAACQQCNPSLAYNPQYSPNAFTGPYSPAASTSISQCFCPANSHFGWGYPNCRYCPANSETLEINAADEGKCGCKAGYWGPRWNCQPCLAGTYKNYVCSAFNCEPQNTACAKCPDGTYQGADGQSTCISCGVGTETHWNGGSTGFNDATIPCKCKLPYIGNPATGCKLCEAGTINWQDHGVNFCLSCSVIDQYRNSSAGSSNPSNCACIPGYTGPTPNNQAFISVSSSISRPAPNPCTVCAAGTYKSVLGSAACSSCPLGKTSLPGSTAESNCRDTLKCNAGYTGPDDGICTECAAGSYKATVGSVSCTLCLAGKYSTLTGQSSSGTCQDCAAGKYATATGQSSSSTCQDCLAGKYVSLTGSSVCENCLAGKYSTATGQSSSVTCQDCLSGKYSTATGQTTCEDCLAGKYSTLTGQSSSGTCQDCSAGKFSGLTGQSSLDTCQHCSAGKYSTATGQSSTGTCQNCATGKFSALTGQSSSATCENCLQGKYSALTGQSSSATCLDCSAGKYSLATGQSVCQDCLAGKYSTGTGQSSSGTCQDCAAGKYATATGQSSSDTCQDCSAGKYSTTTGQSSSGTCQNCLAGKYSTATGQSSSATCQDCLAGKYSSATGQSSAATCQDCLAGKYSAATGQSTSATCQNCLAGTYATLTGSTICDNCLAGKYSAATGQSSAATCQDCLPGKFNSATAQSSCQDCPALSSSSAGSSECFCNPGYWDSYVSCKQCPLGKYRDHVCLATPCAQNTCLACPSGTYAPTPGQSACTKCPVGKSGINT
jgi:hypothetical protein